MSTVKALNFQIGQSLTATNNFTWYQPSTPDGTVRLGVGNAGATTSDVITVNNSGNLGLGVTPSVWDSGFSIIQTGSNGSAFGGRSAANTAYMLSNTVRSGSAWKYINTAAAAQFQVENGAFYWFNAASGTAGNAISFTQAMTLDASGNLVVGDTTATARLTAKASTTDGSTIAIKAINSAGTELFRLLSNGYFVTGSASASPYNNTTASAANLYVDSGGLLYRSTSSARYKNTITDAAHGLAEVLKLRPVTYKGNNDGDTVFGGLIAEEVHDAGLTEFVQYNNDGEPDALAYGNMVSLAFKAIQELSAQVTTLQAEINALKA
jgi:ribosomal protein L21